MQESPKTQTDGTRKPDKLRFVVDSADEPIESSGHYAGQVCHNHVLADIYLQFDSEGALVAIHASDVGSC